MSAEETAVMIVVILMLVGMIVFAAFMDLSLHHCLGKKNWKRAIRIEKWFFGGEDDE